MFRLSLSSQIADITGMFVQRVSLIYFIPRISIVLLGMSIIVTLYPSYIFNMGINRDTPKGNLIYLLYITADWKEG